ncbi:ROK family protein [Cryptosporangium minutisporangium]|uniref:ROK family protein n=1 Tax=Cryptosporangium minutisporangium TaxID=113569 RepID=UPI0035E94AC3
MGAFVGGPARIGSVRAHNLALVLRAVESAATPLSRADVAVATGLTRASVSALVDTLLAGRLLRETGAPTRTGVGRPSTGLVLDSAGPAGLGIELNVDHLAVCLVDLTGAVRARLSGRFPALNTLVGDAVAAGTALGLPLAGAAVAVPGLVDPATGELLVTPNLDVGGVREAVGELSALRGTPVVVENEATLAARAEQRSLGAAAPRSFLQVSGEVGIGAGLVLDGQLYRGRHGWSGELGHVTVRPGGRPCGCGSDGCLEQYAGLRAVLQAAGPGAGTILERATSGDPAMLAALVDAGEAMGIALAGALNLLDLDAVVLGGAHAELAPWLVGPIEAQLSRRLVGAAVSRPAVRASVLGADAAALGAAWSVLDRVLDDPVSWLSR